MLGIGICEGGRQGTLLSSRLAHSFSNVLPNQGDFLNFLCFSDDQVMFVNLNNKCIIKDTESCVE